MCRKFLFQKARGVLLDTMKDRESDLGLTWFLSTGSRGYKRVDVLSNSSLDSSINMNTIVNEILNSVIDTITPQLIIITQPATKHKSSFL